VVVIRGPVLGSGCWHATVGAWAVGEAGVVAGVPVVLTADPAVLAVAGRGFRPTPARNPARNGLSAVSGGHAFAPGSGRQRVAGTNSAGSTLRGSGVTRSRPPNNVRISCALRRCSGVEVLP